MTAGKFRIWCCTIITHLITLITKLVNLYRKGLASIIIYMKRIKKKYVPIGQHW